MDPKGYEKHSGSTKTEEAPPEINAYLKNIALKAEETSTITAEVSPVNGKDAGI